MGFSPPWSCLHGQIRTFDRTEMDTREHIEAVTLESGTKDGAESIKLLCKNRMSNRNVNNCHT